MCKAILIVSFLIFLTAVIWPLNSSGYDKSTLVADKAKGDQIAKKITNIEILAPLAPVALSPFFGITCLSGASILASRGILPIDNAFLMEFV